MGFITYLNIMQMASRGKMVLSPYLSALPRLNKLNTDAIGCGDIAYHTTATGNKFPRFNHKLHSPIAQHLAIRP